jgi:hypothetical protein
MRSLLLFVVLGLCVLGLARCGGSSSPKPRLVSAQGSSVTAITDGVSPVTVVTGRADVGSLEGDEDDDDGSVSNRTSNFKNDTDADFDNDKVQNKGYFDRDDGKVRYFGRPANGLDRRSLIALVTRYYAAAAAVDGPTACSLLNSPYIEARVVDYRGTVGRVYLQGKTCPVIMANLFKHFHAQLAAPTKIVGVRTEGDVAAILLGSSKWPASVMSARRGQGVWRLTYILDRPLS